MRIARVRALIAAEAEAAESVRRSGWTSAKTGRSPVARRASSAAAETTRHDHFVFVAEPGGQARNALAERKGSTRSASGHGAARSSASVAAGISSRPGALVLVVRRAH
jgi:hypothetical protein